MEKNPQNAPASLDKIAILMLGMHRCGTSAATRVINLLGADLPGNLMKPSPGENETGFWESVDVYSLHEEVLQSAGSAWDDWRQLNPDWITSPVAERFRRRFLDLLEQDFGDSSLFVIKDPRACRLVSFWRSLLARFNAEPRVLLPIRNPLEVAASLRTRNQFSPAKSHMLWLRHVLDAERHTRDLPRFLFTYEALLADWRKVIAEASEVIGLAWPKRSAHAEAQIDAFLDSRHRHQAVDNDAVATHPDLSLWVKEAYQAIVALAERPDDQQASATLDTIAEEFDRAGQSLGSVFAAQELQVQGLRSELADSDSQRAAAESRNQALEQAREVLQTQIASLETQAAELKAQIDTAGQQLASAREERDRFRKARDQNVSQLLEKTHQLQALQEKLNSLRNDFQAQQAEQQGLQQQVGELQAQGQSRQRELEALRSHKNEIIQIHQQQVSQFRSQLEEARSKNNTLYQQRNSLLHRLDNLQKSSAWTLVDPLLKLEQRNPRAVWALSRVPVKLRNIASLHPRRRQRLQAEYREALDSGLFDWQWYVERYPEIVAGGSNPLKHWLRTGWQQGLNPNPCFLTSWYLEQYPVVADSGQNPLLHYLRFGARLGLKPNPEFDTQAYLAAHPEISAQGINPLAHYLQHHKPEAKERPLNIRIPPPPAPLPAETVNTGTGGADGQSIPTGDGRDYQAFQEAIRISQQPGEQYQEERPHPTPDPLVKAIAFYLPQFHPIPENDKNWGKGFTEWNNTTRALPRFAGHYQPRLPGELGYYDLRNPDIQKRQIELAKANGIAGFCYHHYWFGGRTVLRRPIDTHFADPEMDLPFCINWANEPWTARWDGHRESGVLIDQAHSPEDDLAFIRDIEPFLRDPRYIRVDGKPLLSVYRPSLFPDMRATLERWQNYCIEQGIGELFTVMVQSFEVNDPAQFGFNGAIEFPPHNTVRKPFHPVKPFTGMTQPDVWDYHAMVEGSLQRPVENFPWFRGVALAWDNSARKSEGWVFHGCTPENYGEWLEGQCRYAMEHLRPDQRLVFINAWNEWAEGTYLEPDAHFGYAFLNRTGEILQKFRRTGSPGKPLLDYLQTRHGDDTVNWAERHFARFGLPVTSEEISLSEPTKEEIDSWLEQLRAAAREHAGRLSADQPDVSILVPVYNQFRYTVSCLVSLLIHPSKYRIEIIIGDDRSSDATSRLAELSVPGIEYVCHPQNLGFLKNCNAIAERARGRYLVLLNNDTVTLPEWLDALIDPLEQETGVGLVGSKLVYPDGRLQEAGSIMFEDASGWNWGNLKDPLDPEFNYRRDADYCSGASVALSTALWRDLGGFDGERYQNAYYEDTDLAFRIREDKGLRVLYQPMSHLIHFEGVSSGRSEDAGIKQYQKTNRPLFVERWKKVLDHHGTAASLPRNFLDRTRTKNLLLVDWITPKPDQDSGSVDTFNFLKIFERLGLNVTLLPERNGPSDRYVRDLQRIGVRVLHEPYVQDFETTLEQEAKKADIIFIYREPAHRHVPRLREWVPDTPIVFDTVDLHFLREQREAEIAGTEEARQAAAETKARELEAMRLSNATIVLSEFEENLLSEMLPEVKLARVPIVREIPGRSDTPFSERHNVLFVGGFLHKPNVDAMVWFTREVWPIVRQMDLGRPCKLVIAGSNTPQVVKELAADDIEVLGFVEDLDALFDKTLISVAPLRYGAGLKGKVISSLSYGVPVIGTGISTEGSGLQHGENVLTADTAEAMAEQIRDLHRDQVLWQKLSDNGLDFCEANFSLQAVGDRLQQLLNDLGIPTPSGKTKAD